MSGFVKAPKAAGQKVSVRALALALAVAASLFGDTISAEAELERTKALIEAGALPRTALEQAQSLLERERLQERLSRYARRQDISPLDLPDMLQTADRLVEIVQQNLRTIQARVDAGAAPVNDLGPATELVESVMQQHELIEKRAELIQRLADMANAESHFDELEEEDLAFSFDGDGGFWPEDVDLIIELYFNVFSEALPISADGDTLLHRSLGLDHTGRVDVALHPDSDEGRFVSDILESWSVPYIAFRSAVPGQATGPHIHIGLASPPFVDGTAAPAESLEPAPADLGLSEAEAFAPDSKQPN